ncbi:MULTISPECIES: TIGR01457 family HAD-type hydrolase [Bacillus]|uniref:TIGR01457 family HAD-type hydrolase n=1 Tax=Bacillus TaxID=1386 RepID=UPI00059FD43C|nr:TIGR01457 family HAD-type hydrolase [Bacillus altitudinis]MCM3061215.1 TIGR01457 family HAD-type hydrolase [Bacillus altitudinis]MCM3073919.1 TIGR01457 family HAD-type hydrolase [Bacillus altitudinis]MCY7454358.1 TIGR01457 family HAD-type hydrolase [Bacillus altitudinis]MEE3603877.1 TIGR01457 family HAD-type hydrolase [Bacillus altitudinis]MEE3610595.1 TIGR01457 family HAD-type hydrolase [Bacillus altitudinis]
MKYKGYLIDLDGTMYKGTEKIEEAGQFVHKLNELNIPYLFVTNNSSRTPKQVAEKLVSFDIPATEEQVFTTSMATANYIAEQKKDASVYVIGEEGIQQAIKEKGLSFGQEDADFVVVGIDRSITYEKLAVGAIAIRQGAQFVSTNGDIAIPTERGLLPGNGSLTSVLTVTTTVQPTFIGKPESIIMEQAMRVLGTDVSETLMVGDNYDTDIMAGMNAGMDTLLVHTGVTTKELLQKYDKQPTYVIDSLSEWIERLS